MHLRIFDVLSFLQWNLPRFFAKPFPQFVYTFVWEHSDSKKIKQLWGFYMFDLMQTCLGVGGWEGFCFLMKSIIKIKSTRVQLIGKIPNQQGE